MSLLMIENDEQNIISTNYWESEHAGVGLFFLSLNAGAYRLLAPAPVEHQIDKMRGAHYVIISRGPWPEQGKLDAIELLFEDYSNSPFVVHMFTEQCDRLPADSDRHKQAVFTIWTSTGKQLELPARYRKVKRLPCLKAWEQI